MTRGLRAQLADKVREGLTWNLAAASVRLPRRTFDCWIARGEAERQRRDAGAAPRPVESKYVNLVAALEQAEHDLRERLKQPIRDAAAAGDKGAARELRKRGL